jgi:hypothetical protein
MFMCIDAFVTERSDRLRGLSREPLRRRGAQRPGDGASLGWNPNSFKSNMNGNSPFSFEQAKKYADKFRVRAEWLYDGNGPMREVSRPARLPIEVPVIGWVSAGKQSRTSASWRKSTACRRQPAAWRVFRDRDCRRQRRPRRAGRCADHRQRRRPHARATATSTSSATAASRR